MFFTFLSYLRLVSCYEWVKDDVTVFTDVKNGNPIKLVRGKEVTIYYSPMHTVISFNPAVFAVPKECQT